MLLVLCIYITDRKIYGELKVKKGYIIIVE